MPAQQRKAKSIGSTSRIRWRGGITFTSGVTTVKGYIGAQEFAASDDIPDCVTAIRIVSNDGTSTVATLGALSANVSANEFNNAATRNKRCFTAGATLTASHTTSAGERLVVEFGARNDADGGATPQYSYFWGENATDCAENETDTTSCAGWIEFSNTITEQGGVKCRGLGLLGLAGC